MVCINRAKRAHLVGLLATDQPPAPSEMDLIRAMFGFAEVRIPEQDITVAWLPFNGRVNRACVARSPSQRSERRSGTMRAATSSRRGHPHASRPESSTPFC